LATGAWRDRRALSSRNQASNSVKIGTLWSRRAARRSSADRPLICRSTSNSRSIRLTASKASGEIGVAAFFVYGRTKLRAAVHEGGSPAKIPRPIDEWRIVVKDRYPPYIDWPTYEKIRAIVRDNRAEYMRIHSRGTPETANFC